MAGTTDSQGCTVPGSHPPFPQRWDILVHVVRYLLAHVLTIDTSIITVELPVGAEIEVALKQQTVRILRTSRWLFIWLPAALRLVRDLLALPGGAWLPRLLWRLRDPRARAT